jgi:hypothetical protein
MTPHARLIHLESASRSKLTSADHTARFARELMALRIRWGETLLRDPFYNPTLSLDPIPFSALAWPVRSFEARVQSSSTTTRPTKRRFNFSLRSRNDVEALSCMCPGRSTTLA